MGIVGGNLWVENPAILKQAGGTGQEIHIRRRFAGEDRIARTPLHLSMLDLSIPIGPFHEPHRDMAIGLPGEGCEPVN